MFGSLQMDIVFKDLYLIISFRSFQPIFVFVFWGNQINGKVRRPDNNEIFERLFAILGRVSAIERSQEKQFEEIGHLLIHTRHTLIELIGQNNHSHIMIHT